MFFSSAWFGEVGVVVFYICVGSTVAELAGDGWPARGGAGRLFFDDTFVFVAIVVFCHVLGWDDMPGHAVVFACYRRYAVGLGLIRMPRPLSLLRASAASGV